MMMIIKKIIFNIAIVTVVVFILDFAIGKTLRFFYFKETSGLHFRTTYSMEATKADMLVFGSSRANHHYVPEIFEDSLKISFYNTGGDGNGIFFQTALLKSVLKRYAPKVIIFDYFGGFEKEENDYYRLSFLLPYFRTHKEIRSIVEIKSPYERIKLISEIYPFNSQIFTILIGNLKINTQRKSDNKGYVALYKEWQAKIVSVETSTTFTVDSNKLSAFREFLSLAKRSGAKVIVIYSPIFLRSNKIQEIDICQDVCSDENIPFWDYSKDTLFLNNNHLFQDILHLNNNGAIIFSKLIVDEIKRDTNLYVP
jgi:hypothetical protein